MILSSRASHYGGGVGGLGLPISQNMTKSPPSKVNPPIRVPSPNFHSLPIKVIVPLLLKSKNGSFKFVYCQMSQFSRKSLKFFCLWRAFLQEVTIHDDERKTTDGKLLVTTTQNMKFSIKDFFSKCDHICRKLRIWPYLQLSPR